MRCPKCGYLSFDLVENCSKCGKNISAAAQALQGTTTSIEPPVFLRFEAEPASESLEMEAAGEEAAEMVGEEPIDLGGEEEEAFLDFSAEEEAAQEAGAMEIEPVEEEFAESAEAEGPSMDIADLAPAEEVEEEIEDAGSEEFAMAEEEAAGEMEGGAHELEDLKVEGLDLESAPPATEKGKVMPSVKTGTALDDFDVDLGDLIPKKK